ncbi:peptidoglycan editing factor PgeF [Vibrio viridaestus]|uniref:Purine nucleoside phosphorylase n=1 Tax=Vibrio viridaestus TaxID=2487322 RepID=A0A3N9U4S8_9VIBR|nr:peptidoglycan editing factor PgeF [Vibrio viridaestus]RQW63086.1 peptidoglycan editing factor PgeF [Vibrio viridaestus]
MIKPDWTLPDSVTAIASTRENGFSVGEYSGLNLGTHVGDDPKLVIKNRQELVESHALPSQPVWLNQTHSTKVVNLESWTDQVLDADGIFTTTPGIVCAVMTADCLPVLLSNKQGTEVAAVHAGWRGLADGILGNAVSYFSNPEDVTAWIGPAISQTYFEVGDEVVQQFVETDSNLISAFEPKAGTPGKWMCNLPLIAKMKFVGLEVYDVELSGLCTFKDETKFYSYRRDGVTGRQGSFIWIKN